MIFPEQPTRQLRFLWIVSALLALAAGSESTGKSASLQTAVYEAKRKVLPALVHIQPVLEIYRSGEKGKLAVTPNVVPFPVGSSAATSRLAS